MNPIPTDSGTRRHLPYRWSLTVFMVLLVAVPLLTVSGLATYWSRNLLAEAEREQNQIILTQMQTILRQQLSQLNQAADSLADADAVLAAFDFSVANGFVPAKLRDELRTLARRLPLVRRIRLIDAGNQVIADTLSGAKTLDEPAQQIIEQLRNRKSRDDLAVCFETVNGRPALLSARTITSSQDNSLVGHLLIDVAPREFFEAVHDLRLENYPHAFAFVIDDGRRFLDHPDPNQVLQSASVDSLDIETLSRFDRSQDVMWQTVRYYNVEFYCSTIWMEEPAWVLGIAIPQQEFDASIVTFVRQLMIVTAIATAIVAAAGWWVSCYGSKKIDRLVAQSVQLEQSRLHAESSNRAKNQFLANMSHEVRTPLNGILGYTELLLRGADDGNENARLDFLKTIRDSGRHLLQLINDILDISKIEAGQFRVEPMSCSPDQILSEVISALRVSSAQKGITLDYRWEGRVPDTIQTDPHRVKQLLVNLVNNAIKFTEKGHVMVVATLDDNDGGSKLRLEVHDTGIGIAADKLESIFEPFVQSDSSLTRKYSGTGLGLAISRKIAESLGGELSVKSVLGRGSVFTATVATGDLYGVKISYVPTLEADASMEPLNRTSLEGVRVLVVDDTDTNRRLVSMFLTRAGATVTTAENGAVSIQAVENSQFDVILMDMQMPVMDGYTATTLLRGQGFLGPIIALTAHAMRGDREKCEAAGCSGYVSKPINMDELIVVVRDSVGTVYRGGARRSEDDPLIQTVSFPSQQGVA
jgi:signal transduction histidine kinase/ActR/RegA family two-component response regulator